MQVFMRARDTEKLKTVVQYITKFTGLNLSMYSYVTYVNGFFPANSEVVTVYPMDANIVETYLSYVEKCLGCGVTTSGNTKRITYVQEDCVFVEFTHFKCNCCEIRACSCRNIIRVPHPMCECCGPYKCEVCLPSNGCKIPLNCKSAPVWSGSPPHISKRK